MEYRKASGQKSSVAAEIPNERKSLYGYGEYILFQKVQILGDGNFSYSSIIGVNLSCCMLYFS